MQKHDSVRLLAGNVDIVTGDMSGQGSWITSDLLFKAVCNFARMNFRFSKATNGDIPIAYSERCLQSIFFSSLSDAGAVAFTEQPIRRKHGCEAESFGWVDFWAYSRQVSFMIEAKHCEMSYLTKRLRKITQNKWGNAVRQLGGITPKSQKDCTFGSKGICRIALLVLKVYRSSKMGDSLEPVNTHDLIRLGKSVAESLSPSPSWCALWRLSKRMQRAVEMDDGSFNSYPGVFFIAWVKKPRR